MRAILGRITPEQAATMERHAREGPGCWLWTGRRDRDGYGLMWIGRGRDGFDARAHRIAFALGWGFDPPPDLVVRHDCACRCCVNPSHLRLGTPADNVADAVRRGRHAHGRRHGAAKLGERDVIAIRTWAVVPGITVAQIAAAHRVSPSTVRAVVAGRTWAHLPLGGVLVMPLWPGFEAEERRTPLPPRAAASASSGPGRAG